ncbi:MAG: hypothetical protein ACE14P_08625 [Methanotrichaceae archaeon]
MKLAISAGLAICCILITSAFAVPAGAYAQNGQGRNAVWLSGSGIAGNYARNCVGSGISEFNREFKNGTTNIEVIKGGHGFALNGDQFHVVNIMIENIRTIDASKASKIRDLLKSNNSNKTIGQLKKEALAIIGEPTYNGSLKLGRSRYRFVNMNVASAGNSSSIDADLIPLVKGAASGSVAGHIKLTTKAHEGFRVSSGDLTLNGASYKVLINMMPI